MITQRYACIIKKSLAAIAASAVLVSNIFSAIPAYGLGGGRLESSTVKSFINEYSTDIAPGVHEKRYSFEDMEGKRTEAFVVSIDMENPNVSVEAATPDDLDGFGLQTVREQADKVSTENHRVVAAVNGDYFTMATGEPFGIVYKDGRAVVPNQFSTWKFFGITKRGKAVIGDVNDYVLVKDDLKEAIGGQAILVKDGSIYEDAQFNAGRGPRTGVGIKQNGDVFFITVDGRQAPYSSGITASEFAKLMIDLGAATALDLDGGGSTTYLSRKPGEDDLQLVNSPSDGRERKVANSWMVVSTAGADHIFDSAFIEPYDKSFTPGSVVQFAAKGRDKSLASAPVPTKGLTWALSNRAFGSIDGSGRFSSNGKTGEFQVLLKYKGKTVGSTWIEIRNPDEIQFASDSITVIGSSSKSLNLSAAFNRRALKLKPGDIEWTIPEGLGSVDEEGVFHASENLATGRITARYRGTDMEDSIDVTIGRVPELLFGFEDSLYSWAASSAGRGESGSAGIISTDREPVRFGNRALRVDFDFTGAQAGTTLGVYAGPGSDLVIPGKPEAIGMWVYGTPEAKGYWLRMAITDDSGNVQNLNLTPASSGIDWTGWKYVEAGISPELTGSLHIHPSQAIRIMSINSGITGPMGKGYIYLDNIRAVYGENVDDVYAPVIESISVDNKVYDTAGVAIEAKLHDYDKDSYSTGINWESIKMLVDGEDYTNRFRCFSYDKDGSAILTGLSWKDGTHEVTVIVQDNFGNEARKTVSFRVKTD